MIRQIRTRFFILIVLWISCIKLLSAEDPKLRYVATGTGWGYASFNDKGISPLQYNGNQITALACFLKKAPKVTNQLQLFFMYGNLYSARHEVMQANIKNYRFEINYAHRRIVWQDTTLRLKVFAGAAWSNLQTNRTHNLYSNSANTSWFMSSAALQAFSEYSFSLFSRSFLLHAGFDLPLMAFAVRPSHAITAQEGFIKGEDGLAAFFSSGKTYFPGSFWGLGSQLGLTYHLKNANAIAIEYRWNYYVFKDINPLQEAYHHLVFKAFFNF